MGTNFPITKKTQNKIPIESAKDLHKMQACSLAHLANRRNSECLRQVLQNTISNLQQHHCSVEEIAADTGYSSGEALRSCIHI